ncbi:hypothetical protein NSB25_17390 [Acetatifactor muris]|uniref:Uncharacterized protein n=1 Tax=Acetatifactor muris TaxID=879566 RepID=A0A2K4ZK29_9FIRM|nr:hypothetical protein [Acetatifactor muris]MCR2049047.1 hypothetical protein [Acetatifactor muris]SOY30810.1 hypothetical protein AMURIS_03541 [Acetatifactor muris]
MDIFTDKLAQKLTAQEIIRANTAADTEELNRLKNRSAEYTECLGKMQKLIEEGTEKLSGMRTDSDETGQALRGEMEELRTMLGQLREQMDGMDKALGFQLEAALRGPGEKLDQLCGQLEAQSSAQLTEKFDALEENVHKECVKVYRNVQAVLVEESSRQGDGLTDVKTGVTSLKGKMNAILTLSVLAMIFSLLGIVMQILGRLNMLPF